MIDSDEYDSDEELSFEEMKELGNDDDNNNENKNENDNETEDLTELNQEIDSEIDDDFDLDQLTQMYNNVDILSDKNIETNLKLISKALKDNKWEKKEDNLIDFNESNDNNVYDELLKNMFKKEYVYNQYIYHDDTIKVMKYKIACSIKNSNKFGKNSKIIPSRQYLWVEYDLNGKTDKVMVGQKWVRRSELLKIDIEPNDNLRVYENLRNNLKYMKDSYGSKIKRDDDEYNIVSDYNDYMTANEIFMIDVYHELGLNYDSDDISKKNLYDVYIQIYFPKITMDNFNEIIEYLNGKPKKENNTINTIYNVNKNDIKLENEIVQTVETTKINDSSYEKLFNDNHVIQSIIHVNLINDKNITGSTNERFNLFRIFDNFIVDENYPFLQYQTPDNQLTYKYYTKSNKIEDKDILANGLKMHLMVLVLEKLIKINICL